MKCPHCNTGIHRSLSRSQQHVQGQVNQGNMMVAPETRWAILYQRCPECHENIVYLEKTERGVSEEFLVYPQNTVRPIAPEVIDPYRQDFLEAVAVLPYSPKASAALSRRCLQSILRDKAATKSKDLFDQIEEVINSGKIPQHIADELHAVRNIGNFAAHLQKSTTTGTVLDVEAGEAEWNLDVLESLFDFYFVQPALSAKRKAQLNQKLSDAGKPPLK